MGGLVLFPRSPRDCIRRGWGCGNRDRAAPRPRYECDLFSRHSKRSATDSYIRGRYCCCSADGSEETRRRARILQRRLQHREKRSLYSVTDASVTTGVSLSMGAFTGPDNKPDSWIALYAIGCASCFAVSHFDSIHQPLLRWSFYRVLNPLLPCGRALFLLAFLQRGVVNQERGQIAGGE